MTSRENTVLRLCYAALHVVLRPEYKRLGHTLARPGDPRVIEEHIDWAATMRLRTAMDRHGLGVAEAMDTAQRFHLGWPSARRLIAECGALKLANGFCAGAGTDQVPAIRSMLDLVDAVVEQCSYITSHGGIPVILPMPWLCEQDAGESDYVDVYEAIVRQVRGPVFVHWLGAMFLPALSGYFPGRSFQRVMALDPAVVRGCKVSLLDADFEVRTRRELLPREQIVLTGDDFHFGRMILGGDAPPAPGGGGKPSGSGTTTIGSRRVALGDWSHALLGILDAIALPMRQALRCLAGGDEQGFLRITDRCEELGRHVFEEPTQHYKAGLAFLAWANGLQQDFTLVNGEERMRDREHYLRCGELARAANAVLDPAVFERRLAEFARAPWPRD
ncbi:MAG TPA: DUF993 family protein [Planctomycetota bacterium]|nr:DUF993 family protein [Planctomycetota bacterium]